MCNVRCTKKTNHTSHITNCYIHTYVTYIKLNQKFNVVLHTFLGIIDFLIASATYPFFLIWSEILHKEQSVLKLSVLIYVDCRLSFSVKHSERKKISSLC